MKKVVLPLIVLIVGLIVGYLLCRYQNNEQLLNSENDKSILPKVFVVEEVTDHVDPVIAKRLIRKFRDWNNKSNPYPFKTEGGGNLNGFFIPKAEIDAIFNGHSNAKGLSIYIGEHPRHEDKNDKVFSFIFMRADTNLNKRLKSDPPYTNSIDTYDYVKPCPDKCGDFAP